MSLLAIRYHPIPTEVGNSRFGLISTKKDIVQKIEANQAVYLAEFDCPKVNYRTVYQSSQPDFNFEITERQFNPQKHNYSLTFFVCLNKPTESNYRPANVHDDYLNHGFQLQAANILAIKKHQYQAQTNTRGSQIPNKSKNKQAIIQFKQNNSKPGEFSLDLLSDTHITLSLPKKVWEYYSANKSRGLEYLLVMPALLEALKQSTNSQDHGPLTTIFKRELGDQEFDGSDSSLSVYEKLHKLLPGLGTQIGQFLESKTKKSR